MELVKKIGLGYFQEKKVFLGGACPAGILFYYPMFIVACKQMKGFGSTRMLKFREPILANHNIMTDLIQKKSVCLDRLFYGE